MPSDVTVTNGRHQPDSNGPVAALLENNRQMLERLEQLVGPLPRAHRAAFEAVDRASFVPEQVWAGGDEDTVDAAIDRRVQPDVWRRAVYDPQLPIVTQWDNGAVKFPDLGSRPTCSSSAPTVVSAMLAALDPRLGDRVLEVGTGTGYNAALLSCIVGERGRVDTVEVDPVLAEQARERLLAAHRTIGNTVVAHGDGTAFTPHNGVPWDRVIATVGVPIGRIPYQWVKHTRPGGVIVAPVYSDLTSDPLVRLVVGEDGVARGHALADHTVGFMRLRSEAPGAAALHEVPWDGGHKLDPVPDVAEVMRNVDWRWAVATVVPRVRYNIYRPGERSPSQLVIFQDPLTRAWASFHGKDEDGFNEVRQGGPRRLADEIVAAIRWYAAQDGPPALEQWLWEVGPEHQRVTLT